MDNLITKTMILIILIILISSFASAWSFSSFITGIFGKTAVTQTNANNPAIKEQPKIEEKNMYKELYEKQLKANDELSKENTKIKLEMASSKLNYERFLWDENYYTFYPTKCKNPEHTFTMCKGGYGCDITYYCDTYSMNPLFWCNAKLTLNECSAYSVGDIVLINNKNKKAYGKYDYLVHSIIGIKSGKALTKGFNNNGIDSFETPLNEIKGKVVKIEY